LNWSYYQRIDKISSVIDFLEDIPEADIERIAIYGISLGGAVAIEAGVFDDRISVIIPSGTNVMLPADLMLLKHRRFDYAYYYQFNIAERPDLYQLLYAAFPKHVIVELNRQDITGIYSESSKAAASIKGYYELRGKRNNVFTVIFDGGKTHDGHYMEIKKVKRHLDNIFFPGKRPEKTGADS